jgi:hypothetical protein
LSRQPGEPEARTRTLRQALRAALDETPRTLRELSVSIGSPERELQGHLEHLEHSLAAEGISLVVLPPRCHACGFAFKERERRSKPSRCPRCKSERIEPARFALR